MREPIPERLTLDFNLIAIRHPERARHLLNVFSREEIEALLEGKLDAGQSAAAQPPVDNSEALSSLDASIRSLEQLTLIGGI